MCSGDGDVCCDGEDSADHKGALDWSTVCPSLRVKLIQLTVDDDAHYLRGRRVCPAQGRGGLAVPPRPPHQPSHSAASQPWCCRPAHLVGAFQNAVHPQVSHVPLYGVLF